MIDYITNSDLFDRLRFRLSDYEQNGSPRDYGAILELIDILSIKYPILDELRPLLRVVYSNRANDENAKLLKLVWSFISLVETSCL